MTKVKLMLPIKKDLINPERFLKEKAVRCQGTADIGTLHQPELKQEAMVYN